MSNHLTGESFFLAFNKNMVLKLLSFLKTDDNSQMLASPFILHHLYRARSPSATDRSASYNSQAHGLEHRASGGRGLRNPPAHGEGGTGAGEEPSSGRRQPARLGQREQPRCGDRPPGAASRRPSLPPVAARPMRASPHLQKRSARGRAQAGGSQADPGSAPGRLRARPQLPASQPWPSPAAPPAPPRRPLSGNRTRDPARALPGAAGGGARTHHRGGHEAAAGAEGPSRREAGGGSALRSTAATSGHAPPERFRPAARCL